MKNLLSVKEVAKILQKSEETVKRWLRAGKFPNAHKKTDRQGWQIPQQDLRSFMSSSSKPCNRENRTLDVQSYSSPQDENTRELVLLAYQAVTMTSPTESLVNILNHIGIKRTLEILLIMQQSPNKVKNPEGFIKKAISKGWSPTTLPIKKERNIARMKPNTSTENRPVPSFYNWLDN